MRTARVSMIILSHLSDVQETLAVSTNHLQINFAKWLVMKFPDTNVEIDPDAEWKLFNVRKFEKPETPTNMELVDALKLLVDRFRSSRFKLDVKKDAYLMIAEANATQMILRAEGKLKLVDGQLVKIEEGE